MIQRDRVKGAGGLSEGDEQIASESKFLLDSSKYAGLLSSRLKLDGYGSFQLPPSFYVFGSFNVFLYGLRTGIASSSNIVGGRPQRPDPQFLFQVGKQNEKLPGCSSFQNLYYLGNRNCWRDSQGQMDMLWLDFFRDNRPIILMANLLKQTPQSFSNTINKY
jgi:hypothetical protein